MLCVIWVLVICCEWISAILEDTAGLIHGWTSPCFDVISMSIITTVGVIVVRSIRCRS